jgi:hypothetical protein
VRCPPPLQCPRICGRNHALAARPPPTRHGIPRGMVRHAVRGIAKRTAKSLPRVVRVARSTSATSTSREFFEDAPAAAASSDTGQPQCSASAKAGGRWQHKCAEGCMCMALARRCRARQGRLQAQGYDEQLPMGVVAR